MAGGRRRQRHIGVEFIDVATRLNVTDLVFLSDMRGTIVKILQKREETKIRSAETRFHPLYRSSGTDDTENSFEMLESKNSTTSRRASARRPETSRLKKLKINANVRGKTNAFILYFLMRTMTRFSVQSVADDSKSNGERSDCVSSPCSADSMVSNSG